MVNKNLCSERKGDNENVRLSSHQDEGRHLVIIVSPRPFTFTPRIACNGSRPRQ